MPKYTALPPLEELQKKLVYDPETGLFYHRYTDRRAVAGAAAGRERSGYITIGFNNKRYRANRLAWLFGHKQDPGSWIVEHENENKLDNSLRNLRLATNQQNQWNKSISKGAYAERGKFYASININGTQTRLGTFLTFEEAQTAYREKAVELRGEFAPQAWRQGSA